MRQKFQERKGGHVRGAGGREELGRRGSGNGAPALLRLRVWEGCQAAGEATEK